MPTKNEIKLIRSLKLKKFRNEHKLFVAEGEKLVQHLLKMKLQLRYLYTTHEHLGLSKAELISKKEMDKISFLNHSSSVFAVFEKPPRIENIIESPFLLLLDGIRDPGNMGTIIRLCDWFGLAQLICTADCVDVFNEKVVQSSMGSIASVNVLVEDRIDLIQRLKSGNFTMIGTEMNAPSAFETSYPPKTVLVLGNEGQGISKEIDEAISQYVSIPSAATSGAESLNVAMAAAIFLGDYAKKSMI